MNTFNDNTSLSERFTMKENNIFIEGYPSYPAKEDIYSQYKNAENINPEDISRNKNLNENDKESVNNEIYFDEDVSGDDLDVPGSELDDEEENIGSEDEENNYYSLGGDDHNDLEEDKVE
jgi:hypothetical protein